MKFKYTNGVILITLLLMAFSSEAQIKLGIRAGINATNISFNDLSNRSERYGYHAGVFVVVPVIPNFLSVQPELSYSVKGVAFKPLNKREVLSMDYIDLMLPVGFKLSAFEILVGPFASYLVSTADYTAPNDTKVIVGAFKKIDAGLSAGLSFNFRKFLVGVRYNQGFVDITKDNAQLVLGSGKNAVGQAFLGFKF